MMGLWIHFGSVAVLVTSWINPGWMDGWMEGWVDGRLDNENLKKKKIQESPGSE